MWHMYKYVLKHPFEHTLKQTYRNVVFRDHIYKGMQGDEWIFQPEPFRLSQNSPAEWIQG